MYITTEKTPSGKYKAVIVVDAYQCFVFEDAFTHEDSAFHFAQSQFNRILNKLTETGWAFHRENMP